MWANDAEEVVGATRPALGAMNPGRTAPALEFNEAVVFNSDKISSWDKKFKGRPFRTFSGTRYLGGYSDHYPVYVKLLKK